MIHKHPFEDLPIILNPVFSVSQFISKIQKTKNRRKKIEVVKKWVLDRQYSTLIFHI